MPPAAAGLFERILSRLGLRWLALLFGALFLLDVFVPDPIPFIDEAMLALITILLAQLPRPRSPQPPVEGERPMKNVTPPRQ